MGNLSGNLDTIVLGAGLGILAISCLTVTICFGRCANSFTAIDKLNFKIDFNGSKEAYDCAVAIAVLGCLAFVAALAALALSIVMDGQTMILIIVGGVASVFAFGCIVAEGVYTSKAIKINSFEEIGEVPKKEDAQKYIIGAIHDFYTKLTEKIKDDFPDDDLSDYFPNDDHPERLWGGYGQLRDGCDSRYSGTFRYYDGMIYACTKKELSYPSNGNKAYVIASTTFSSKDTYTPKYRVCKYNSDKTNYKCKVLKGEEDDLNVECDMTEYSI